MAVEQEQIKDFLPIGEQLRAMISQSFLTAKHLKDLLNDQGVFIDENDKNKSIPILMSTILSPKEFERLVENQTTKEEKFKTNTLTIPCKTEKKLLEIIPPSFSLNKIIGENLVYKPNYKVKGNPQFELVENNPNRIQLSYEIERDNKTKDWVQTKTTHKALITIEKKSDSGINLILTKNHTSKETNEINEMLLKNLKNNFKDAKVVKEEEDFVRILFKDFDNKNRIQFFYSFTSPSISRNLEFVEISDINVQLDENVNSPLEIKDFISGIKNLKINGSELQEHIFITNQSFHDKIIFSSISLKYKFDMIGTGVKGICIVDFSFPEYVNKQKVISEFQFDLTIIPDKECRDFINFNKLNNDISKIFENYKLEQFEKYKLKGEE
ncbi:GapS4b family protein [Flavobacterium sp. UBA7663]|uniref:GapS4b family protein n=1 Tax=Flavobacterium sp. UBA7663 TaxID=1946557 RepID=UPI0025BF854F|nr:hypothetical protein [Flavobacterium sp. UBA7663]